MKENMQNFNVPEEIGKQGSEAVARYFESLAKDGIKQINEARIIILGEKRAGKTSLARRLIESTAPMPCADESTVGVSVSNWLITSSENNNSPSNVDTNVYIWDFAGHAITHSVHQLFMSSRCLYIYVYDGRSEDDNRVEYWLELIRIYGGDSPIIFLVNLKDYHKPSIDKNNLKHIYPSILGFYDVNIINTEDMEKFREVVLDIVQNNPTWNKAVIPSSTYKIMTELRTLFISSVRDYITFDEFRSIAERNGLNPESLEAILGDLHSLGICFWYRNIHMPDFNTIVLNPDWIMYGIYKVINWASNNDKHILSISDSKMIFSDDNSRYPEDRIGFLFRLMCMYDLAFMEDCNKIFIPMLLPMDTPDSLPEFPLVDSLFMQFRVEKVLPPNIICRLITRRHREITDEKNVWRRGAVLHLYSGDAVALIIEDRRSILVKVKGQDKTVYLSDLRNTLQDIFESYKNIQPSLAYQLLVSEEFTGKDFSNKPLLVSEDVITAHIKNRMPYFEISSGMNIPLDNIARAYNIVNLTASNIETAIISPKSQYDVGEIQKQLLSNLKQKYQEENLTLVLGAGVSIGAGILQWNTLINRLLVEMINEKRDGKKPFDVYEINKIIEYVYGFGDSPLALMQYVRITFDYDKYINIIHRVLYEKNPEGNTALLGAIANLCKPRRKHLGVKNIITYNFDDLLEKTLDFKEIEYNSIYRDIDVSDIGSLNIYHVHGYLPSNLNNLDVINDINLVFSEEDYHRIYRDSYHWSNIVQLNSFRENSCLFIGCSLTDPNMRRLLDVAIAARKNEAARKKEELKPHHYAIIKKRSSTEKIEGVRSENFEEWQAPPFLAGWLFLRPCCLWKR